MPAPTRSSKSVGNSIASTEIRCDAAGPICTERSSGAITSA